MIFFWPVFVYLLLPYARSPGAIHPQYGTTAKTTGLAYSAKERCSHIFIVTVTWHYVKGVIVLLSDHIVCKKGDTLTPEQARLLVSMCVVEM